MKFIIRILASKNIYITKSLVYTKNKFNMPINGDYIRASTLQLCCKEIIDKKVEGSVAELGGYKGNFASQINHLLPEKKLYLFDTFEGFSERNKQTEITKSFSTANQDFSDTSKKLVLSKMKSPQNCVIKKGFFPDTSVDVSDSFCLVSIDPDLYEPTLAGLRFFYPRLNHGGYIFIHDFNNDNYKGAKQAVLEFCQEQSISYLPIADACGTVIITK